jgi:hypothetical protein
VDKKEAESTEMTDSTSVAMDTAVVAETQNRVAAANADFNISYRSNCSRFS